MATEGQSGAQQIARLEKGDSTRTARHADVMNEIIDRVNSLLSLTVSPTAAGKFIWSDANGVLQLDSAAGGIQEVFTDDTSDFEPGSGAGEVQNVTSLMLDEDLFEVFADGTTAVIKLRTETCGDIDGGDSG